MHLAKRASVLAWIESGLWIAKKVISISLILTSKKKTPIRPPLVLHSRAFIQLG